MVNVGSVSPIGMLLALIEASGGMRDGAGVTTLRWGSQPITPIATYSGKGGKVGSGLLQILLNDDDGGCEHEHEATRVRACVTAASAVRAGAPSGLGR